MTDKITSPVTPGPWSVTADGHIVKQAVDEKGTPYLINEGPLRCQVIAKGKHRVSGSTSTRSVIEVSTEAGISLLAPKSFQQSFVFVHAGIKLHPGIQKTKNLSLAKLAGKPLTCDITSYNLMQ